MKYHTIFFSKIGEDVASAAVVIDALRVKYALRKASANIVSNIVVINYL